MIVSCLLFIVIAYPLFSFLKTNISIQNVILCQAIIAILNTAFAAPTMALLSTLFPVHECYSGIGFGYALGGALLGGTTPLIIVILEKWLNTPMIPAYYLMFSSILGVVCVLWSQKEKNAPLVRAIPDELSQAA